MQGWFILITTVKNEVPLWIKFCYMHEMYMLLKRWRSKDVIMSEIDENTE